MDVGFVAVKDLTLEQYLEITALVHSVWPPKEAQNPEQKFRDLKASGAVRPEGYALVRKNGQLLASAFGGERIVSTSHGELPVMTLGAVCSDPQGRGRGYGDAVVKLLFEMVDSGVYPVCLFQTSFKVEPFYQRFGARRITNRIDNSRRDPAATALQKKRQLFWDDIVMIYPGSFDWPTGPVDLRGPGY